MTPREYIETAMKLAVRYGMKRADALTRRGPDEVLKAHKELETHLREHLDEIIEAAYDKGLEDRDED